MRQIDQRFAQPDRFVVARLKVPSKNDAITRHSDDEVAPAVQHRAEQRIAVSLAVHQVNEATAIIDEGFDLVDHRVPAVGLLLLYLRERRTVQPPATPTGPGSCPAVHADDAQRSRDVVASHRHCDVSEEDLLFALLAALGEPIALNFAREF
jgi:hypothetical protein